MVERSDSGGRYETSMSLVRGAALELPGVEFLNILYAITCNSGAHRHLMIYSSYSRHSSTHRLSKYIGKNGEVGAGIDRAVHSSSRSSWDWQDKS